MEESDIFIASQKKFSDFSEAKYMEFIVLEYIKQGLVLLISDQNVQLIN